MRLLKHAFIVSCLALLIGGGASISAQAATTSVARTASSTTRTTASVVPETNLPVCDAGRDGVVIWDDGYWECMYVDGVGWVWILLPPTVCGSKESVSREPLTTC